MKKTWHANLNKMPAAFLSMGFQNYENSGRE